MLTLLLVHYLVLEWASFTAEWCTIMLVAILVSILHSTSLIVQSCCSGAPGTVDNFFGAHIDLS
jgi:uncharacterized membrane protein